MQKKGFLERLIGLPRTNPRLLAQLIFVFIGVIGLAVFWPRVITPPTIPYRDEHEKLLIQQTVAYELAKTTIEAQRTLWRGFAVTVLMVGLVDLLTTGLGKLVAKRERRDFEQFFGREVTQPKGGSVAVFNSPTVAEQHLDFGNAPAAAKNAKAVAEGIQHVVPYEDLRATLEISRQFEHFESRMDIAVDEKFKDIWPEGQTVIAVGLGFNAVTARIALLKPGLFHVYYNETTKAGSPTDGFSIGPAQEKYQSIPNYDHALFARVVEEATERVFFVCAGRTAEGTEAACHYLAHHWKDMLRLYRTRDTSGNKHTITESLVMMLRHVEGKPDHVEECRHIFMP